MSFTDSGYWKKVSEGNKSSNVQTNGYDGSYHASPIHSFLYEWKGNLYRLEYISGKIILEKYDSSFKYLGKGEIEPELPIFGGFFAGEDYNFIIYGDKNLSESNDNVTNYSKLGELSYNENSQDENQRYNYPRYKLIYRLYSFTSDLGSHVTEGNMTQERTIEHEETYSSDALMGLRMTQSFLLWIVSANQSPNSPPN